MNTALRRIIFKNFRIVDAAADFFGSLIVEDGIIAKIIPHKAPSETSDDNAHNACGMIINGADFLPQRGVTEDASYPALMPAFIDLHAHFRDTGSASGGAPLPAETVESACLAAAAGGFGTVVCMANTKPVIDTVEKAHALKQRSDTLGLIDLYPVISLTKNMDGRELTRIPDNAPYRPLLLSEDGKDIYDDALFLAAMEQAARLGIPVSCHCDCGGHEAEAAKAAGRPRPEWSRIEENNAVRRAIELGKRAACHVHIAHVSTKEAAAVIRNEKKSANAIPGFTLTCEAAPHHIAANEEDARRMGENSRGRVNPPLRNEADRLAIIEALRDGTIDAIATDHAPHSEADKAAGAPGFSGLETAFGACLAAMGDLRQLSALMSAAPARIIGVDRGANARGRIAPGQRADLIIADSYAKWNVDTSHFFSRGACTPFAGKTLWGKILMTVHKGRIVFDGGGNA